jgi:hypothetical protein
MCTAEMKQSFITYLPDPEDIVLDLGYAKPQSTLYITYKKNDKHIHSKRGISIDIKNII